MSFALQPRPSRAEPAAGGTVHVIQGEYKVSDDPNLVMATILGSCVAACMRDPIAGIGGINHFLLPGKTGPGSQSEAERSGVHAMELLVNALLSRGAQRRNLEVKLFGGAKTVTGLSDVGAQNATFALEFVRRERIKIVGECLMGNRARRLQYWPVSGRARRIFLASAATVVERPAIVQAPLANSGELELF